MTRVTELSNKQAVNLSMGKTKEKLEDLQLKGSTLKRMTRPSDDPTGNVDLLFIRSSMADNQQYQRNANFVLSQLNFAETAISELAEIIDKAKELAIGQSSDLFNPEVRIGVANEIHQMRQQILGLSNKRAGNRYIFAGQKTLTRPFDKEGNYHGDNKQIFLEVAKDFFVPINLTGKELFFQNLKSKVTEDTPFKPKQPEGGDLNTQPQDETNETIRNASNPKILNREIAGSIAPDSAYGQSIFKVLESLETSLMTNDSSGVQNLLVDLDQCHDQAVAMRTRLGSLVNSIEQSNHSLVTDDLENATQKSKIEDADVTELFSDISRQQAILEATYKTGSELLNSNLLRFLR